jgi:hypothetical protein
MNNYYPKITGNENPTFWDKECKVWLDAGKPDYVNGAIKGAEWYKVLRPNTLKEYNNTCANCGVKKDRDMGCDHVMTRHEGGGNVQKNLQILCRSCNSRKQALSLPKLQPWVGPTNKENDARCMQLRKELSSHCKALRGEIKALYGMR